MSKLYVLTVSLFIIIFFNDFISFLQTIYIYYISHRFGVLQQSPIVYTHYLPLLTSTDIFIFSPIRPEEKYGKLLF